MEENMADQSTMNTLIFYTKGKSNGTKSPIR